MQQNRKKEGERDDIRPEHRNGAHHKLALPFHDSFFPVNQ